MKQLKRGGNGKDEKETIKEREVSSEITEGSTSKGSSAMI